jgi:ABC-type polysaccharide/polyol phosphate export permease
MYIEDEIRGAKSSYQQALTSLAVLMQAHAALLQTEIRERARTFVGAVLLCAFGVMGALVALMLGALALAGVLSSNFPSLGEHQALALVALLAMAVVVGLVISGLTLLRRSTESSMESLTSLKESVLCVLREVS